MNQPASGRDMMSAAVEQLRSEGLVVWGFIVNKDQGEMEAFGSHNFQQDELFTNTASCLEAVCPEYFAKYISGEAPDA